MLTKEIRRLYVRARASGYRACEAMRNAKIVAAFEARDDVRITAEPSDESYFDVYGEPEGYVDVNGRWHSPEMERKELIATIDRHGLWTVISEVLDPQTGEWEMVDSVGMNCGYSDPCDWLENCYVPDLMSAALEAAENRFAGV